MASFFSLRGEINSRNKVPGARRTRLQMERLEQRLVLASTPLITEFMASNDATLADGDGNYSDWIEIHNPTAAAIDLAGWHLTDKATNLDKWTFPSLSQSVLDPGEYLVVFASGQTTETYVDPGGNLHTDFGLSAGGEYLALTDATEAIIHEFAPEFSPQSEDVSYGLADVEDTNSTTFMVSPTPGAANIAGGPVISTVTHDPPQPTATENLIIEATVSDNGGNGIARVDLHFRINYDLDLQTQIFDDGQGNDQVAGDGIFTGVIDSSQYATGDMVRWYVTAEDDGGMLSRAPFFSDPLADEYLGTVVRDPSESTLLPTFEFFVENPDWYFDNGLHNDLPIHKEFTTSSVYYDGEFYDNVRLRVRGASSVLLNFAKQSFHFDFSKEHRFKFFDDEPRLDEINVNTMQIDEAFVRNHLSMEIFAMAGAPAMASDMWLVRQNGVFYTVGNFIEHPDEQFLERNGLDPEGALYKVYNKLANANDRPEWTPGASPNSLVGVEKKTRLEEDNADLQAFIDGIAGSNPSRAAYLFDNLDIPVTLNYMVASVLDSGKDVFSKNNYVYRDTNGTGEWLMLPWDRDVAWGWDRWRNRGEVITYDQHPLNGSTAGGDAYPIFDAVLETPELKEMFLRRLRSVMDEILQEPGTPAEELFLDQRLNALLAQMEDEVNLDKSIYGDLESPTQSMATAIAAIIDDYLAPRRTFLYDTHSIDNVPDTTTLVASDAAITTAVPTDNSWDLASPSWKEVGFDDSTWRAGVNGVGYDVNTTYDSFINTDVQDLMHGSDTSIYIRIPFNVADPGSLTNLTLLMQYDDGFVASINGVEVEADRAPGRDGYSGTLDYDSNAAADHSDSSAVNFLPFDITSSIGLLNPGENILAIQGLNISTSSSDFLITAELAEITAGTPGAVGIPHAQVADPTVSLGAIDFNPLSGNQDEEYFELYNPGTDAIDLTNWLVEGAISHSFKPGTVIAAGSSLYLTPSSPEFRARTSGPSGGQGLFVQQWDSGHLSSFSETITIKRADGSVALSEAYPGDPSPAQEFLRITEVHYNPTGPNAAEMSAGFTDGDQFEFIELLNTGSSTLDLAGVHFDENNGGVSFAFEAGDSLAAGQRGVLVSDLAAFQQRYGMSVDILGVYADNIANGGEQIKLEDASNSTILQFSYQDGADPGEEAWPTGPDGNGPSLVVIDTAGDYSDGTNWQASAALHGTPGTDNTLPLPGDYDNSGDVTTADYALWKQTFGSTIDLRADGNDDGVVNAADYTVWRDNLALPPATARAVMAPTVADASSSQATDEALTVPSPQYVTPQYLVAESTTESPRTSRTPSRATPADVASFDVDLLNLLLTVAYQDQQEEAIELPAQQEEEQADAAYDLALEQLSFGRLRTAF